MQIHIATSKLFLAFGAMLLAVSLTPLCFAQNQPAAPPSTQVTIIHVNPEMAAEFREYLKNDSLPAYLKAGVKERSVWVRATFGEGFEYGIGMPIENLAQYDNPNPLVKALGQAGYDTLSAKRNRMIAGTHTFVVQPRPELSDVSRMTAPPKLAFMSTITVAPGRSADFEKYFKNDLMPILKKVSNVGIKGNLVSRAGLGGNTNQYVTLNFFDSFADFEKWAQALGKVEGYSALSAKTVGIITQRETAVWRYVPELSIAPTPAKTASK